MMTVAPDKRVTTVPVSLLGANWRPLMGADRETNAIISGREPGGARQLYPVRLRLGRKGAQGATISFVAKPLKRSGQFGHALGERPRAFEDLSVIIDPTVSDQIKALWASLLSFFGGESGTRTIDPPASPVNGSGSNARFSGRDGTYKGPDGAAIGTEAGWRQTQGANLDAAGGNWTGDLSRSAPDLLLSGAQYDGLALFNHDFGTVDFVPTESVAIENLAIVGNGKSTVERVGLSNAEVGGATFENLRTDAFNVSNSVFDGVDMSGMAITSTDAGIRSTVQNSVFFNVSADEPVLIHGVDFTSVSFQNADLKNSELQSTTFQGSGLMNVDLSGSSISGPDPSGNDNTFQPTFDHSILDNVNLDRTTLENVSFAGVDFTAGNVSLEGATLRNVDFTGAIGLQFVDWTKVTIEGNVYGIGEYGHQLELDDPAHLRTWTEDGVVPEIDDRTGYDIEASTGYLIDPGTGFRYEVNDFTGALDAINPATDAPFVDPRTGGALHVEGDELVNPTTGEHFEIDFHTGTFED